MKLVIPDSKYEEAGAAVAALRRKFEPYISDKNVENFLRIYVLLGQEKQIKDYGYSLSDADKKAIVQKVAQRTSVPFEKAKNLLDFMEILATSGNVSPLIARPRFAQEQFDTGYDQVHKDDPKFLDHIEKGVGDFFGFASKQVGNIFESLGSFKYVIYLGGALLVLYFLNQLRK